ncbi:SUMF1/EgtB/PvdO family nonheme iron enzyme [Candidatus Accumulibacter sp. ACC003]|uniref:nSTAND1 domain-containing NTPase n=1 Tax=Candidatus Accumulibacter sp. ACC003 TaxID=2823334 RepID=UPI0025C035AB|nr:SUMF1/EgtB/PvdO family nonheme iron enzyme [Candidatus Accumulibacter sp. ACC003]
MTHSAAAPDSGRKTVKQAAAPGLAPSASSGNPYPGLAAYRPEEHQLFFGRDDDSQRIVDRLAESRLISVIGRSGTGKSSLVAAGVVPRLAAQLEHLSYLRFEPQGSPFQQLADALCRACADDANGRRRSLVDALQRALAEAGEAAELEERLAAACVELLGQWGRPLLLLVDQAEDLFTHTPAASAQRFRQLCARLLEVEGLRLALTLRSEFAARLMEWLGEDLFRASLVALEPIREEAQLQAIITGPAGARGVSVQAELVSTLLAASNATKGALPLIALTLEQLFEQRDAAQGLTLDAYQRMGGIESIVDSAASSIDRLIAGEPELESACGRLFAELATVIDELPTRRAAAIEPLRADRQVGRLVDALRRQGFLTDPDDQHVELAHATLFSHWPRLRQWCARHADSLLLRRQAKHAAREWRQAVDHDAMQSPGAQSSGGELLRWSWERQKPVLLALLELSHRGAARDPYFHDPGVAAWRALDDRLDEPLRSFLRPEPLRLMEELSRDETPHHRREEIGLRLNQMGDPRRGVGLADDGLPEIVWVEVAAGEVELEGKASERFTVKPFRISRYAITWQQYNAFLNADDGYHDRRWWRKLVQRKQPGEARWSFHNHPAIHVSWSDAVAFCRWLSEKWQLPGPAVVRLPTDWEWQWVAQAGGEKRKYPWGAEWHATRANSHESGTGRTMAVGMYPLAVAEHAMVADLAGNVWEWCLNEYHQPSHTQVDGDSARALRGGSWLDFPGDLRSAKRDYFSPDDRDGDIGFRVVLADPLE